MYIYSEIELENLYVMNKGIQFAISAEPYEARNRKIDWLKTKRLMTGTLLALVMITYNNIRQLTNLTDLCLLQFWRDQTQGTITIHRESDSQFLLLLIHSKNKLNHSMNCSCQVYIYWYPLDDSLLILENKVFFETYVHYLNCLKDKDPTNFPFQD